MYELVQVLNNSYYIESPAKIGLYRINEEEVYLIDSGNDKEAGRRVKKVLQENGWTIKAIINTHSHADHVGGNKYLQNNYHCDIYTNRAEGSFTQNPYLEPSYLFGGYPFKELRNKFLMAQESEVKYFEDQDFPSDFEIIPLPGHTFDMVGFRTPDDVVYLADSVMSEETINKYQIVYLYDVQGYLDTLDVLDSLEAKMFVPSHTAPTENLSSLIASNKQMIENVISTILDLCKEGLVFDDLMSSIFNRFEIKMNEMQYMLIGSTIKSYLGYLKDNDKIEIIIKDNRFIWKSK